MMKVLVNVVKSAKTNVHKIFKMLKNDPNKFVMFEKCFETEKIYFKKAVAYWDYDKVYASKLMKQAFPHMGLFHIKRHLEDWPGFPRDFNAIKKEYLDEENDYKNG